jgi:hypothetical protein
MSIGAPVIPVILVPKIIYKEADRVTLVKLLTYIPTSDNLLNLKPKILAEFDHKA